MTQRFTVTTRGTRGRPKIEKTDDIQQAWEIFSHGARQFHAVTLHDSETDIEVDS